MTSPINNDVRLFGSRSFLSHETVKKYPAPLAAVLIKVRPTCTSLWLQDAPARSFAHTQQAEKAAAGRTATLPCKSPPGVQLGSSRSSWAMLLGSLWGRCHLGRCVLFLVLALLLDVVGLVFLLLGILASLSYWDFFVYTGALILAFSLLFWVLWYSLNIEVSPEKLDL